MFELIFNVKNGLYCPECGKNESFDTYDNIYNHLKQYEDKISNEYELIEHINELRKCPICGKDRNDVIRFNPENENEIMVYDTCIDKDAYDFLRKIVLYQNMPDFNDEYINPDLKRDLELAAKLENPNNVTPTLEKQELCIVASTSYKIHEIEEMSIRHMVMLLRIVDAKIHYQVYQTAKTSGFVTFKGELEHWIYSSDKPHSMLEKAMSLEGLKGKMKPVTG